jgi:hypothetical protein
MRYSGKFLGLGHYYSVASLTNLFLTLAELLLLLRVVLKFFFTTANSGFVHWAYRTTDVLLTPFRGIFSNPTSTPGTWHIDWVALLAMAVYAALGALLVGLATWNFGIGVARRNHR